MDSTILNDQQAQQLRQWLGTSCKFTTLYRSSRDGATAAAFHSKCNGKPKNVTVVRSTTGNVFGGYTSLAWGTLNNYGNDPSAFLFILCSANGAAAPEKLNLNAAAYAIYDSTTNGPTFGGNYDLSLFDSGTATCYSYMPGSTGYNKPAAGQFAMGNGTQNFTIAEVEVLDVSQPLPPPPPVLPQPWRRVTWSLSELEKLQRSITNYKPEYGEELKVDHANILVIAGTGAGKTSFLNTLQSSMLGRISSVGAQGKGVTSLTLNLHKHQLARAASVRIWDTMGWGPSTYQSGEMNYIIDGNLPSGSPIDGASPDTKGFVAKPTFGQKVHVILVLVAPDMLADDAYVARLRNFRDLARGIRGISVLIGLTKVDQIDKTNLDSTQYDGSELGNVFLSVEVRKEIEKLAQRSGIDERDILPLKNYCKVHEQETNLYVDILSLMALKRLLDCADDYFIKKHNASAMIEEENN